MYIGTAGWNLPKIFSHHFPEEGSHLQRYAALFNAVEINSSFYREHQAKTYSRWAVDVPDEFRFSVKLNQAFTHKCGFRPKVKDVHSSLDNILHLEKKLGMILIQLPGSLEFNLKDAERFYKIIRKKYDGPLVLEPRNTGWISKEGQALMKGYDISKVIADPEKCPSEKKPKISYYRLHGSPVIYRSSYTATYIKKLAKEMKVLKNGWCIFDNTTFGLATENALDLKGLLLKS